MKLGFLAVFVALLGSGCGSWMGMVRQLPPPYDVGLERRMAVEVVAGKKDLSTLSVLHGVSGIFTGESNDPHVPVEALKARLPARLSESRYLTWAPGEEADLLFHLTVIQWWTQVWDLPESDGGKHIKATLVTRLRVSKRANDEEVTVRDYGVTAKAPLPEGGSVQALEPALVDDAVEQTVGRITYEFVPTPDERLVRLDDSAPEVKPALALIEKGELQAARAALEKLLQQSPGLAAAHYNLGMLDEAESNFPAAAQRYREAERLKSRLLYRDGLRRVETLRQVHLSPSAPSH